MTGSARVAESGFFIASAMAARSALVRAAGALVLAMASRTVGRSSGCAGPSATIGHVRRRSTVDANGRMTVTIRIIFTVNACGAVGRYFAGELDRTRDGQS